MRARIRGPFGSVASLIAVMAAIYGEIAAIRTFFDMQICAGTDCHWAFQSWPTIGWLALFVFLYIPLSPLLGIYFAFPGYLLASVLYWIGGPEKKHRV